MHRTTKTRMHRERGLAADAPSTTTGRVRPQRSWVRLAAERRCLIAIALVAGCASGAQQAPSSADEGSLAGGHGPVLSGPNEESGGAAGKAESTPGTDGGGGEVLIEDDCGNDKIDPGETCDGAQFGDLSCASYGLKAGTLTCDVLCDVRLAGCGGLAELCDNAEDDDGNGFIDCADEACAGLARCVDACDEPTILHPPEFSYGFLGGRSDGYQPSCAGASGPEQVFQFTAAATTVLYLSVQTSRADNFNLAVTSGACGTTATEVACSAHIHRQGYHESLQLAVTAGTTYFVFVDGATADVAGRFLLDINTPAEPEPYCADGWDNDYDGKLDCDDEDCQASAACRPGSAPLGAPCELANECSASSGRPLCLPSSQGVGAGHCSQFCDLDGADCASGAVCYDQGFSARGVCLKTCATDPQCPSGTHCRQLGLTSLACYPD